MSSRLLHIDIAKGIGIAFVVLGHNWITLDEKGELFRVIFSFHMPLFFFLSGLMLRPAQPWAALVRGKTASLLKPYLLASLLAGLVGGFSLEYLCWVLYATGDKLVWIQLWFLPNLWLVFLFAKAFVSLSAFDRRPPALQAGLLLLLLLAGYAVMGLFRTIPLAFQGRQLALPGLPFCADLVLITGFYFLCGYALRERVLAFRQRGWLFALCAAVFAGLHYRFNVTLDFNRREYDDLLIATLQAAAGIYLVLALSAWLAQTAWPGRRLAYLGSASLFVMIFHTYFQDQVFLLIDDHLEDMSWLNVLGSFTAGLLLPLLVWEAVRRNALLARLWLPVKA